MAATIFAGFNTARIGTLNVLLSDAAVTNVEAVLTAGKYSHVDIASVMGTGKYTALAAAVQAALLVASPSADYGVSFSTTTRQYTISNAGNSFTLNFTDTGTYTGARLAKALGLTASNSLATGGTGYACTITSSGADVVSDVLPYYLVPLARAEPAAYSRPYEQTGSVKRKVTTNANAVSTQPLTIPQFVDFKTLYMPLANVHSSEAAAAQPWTIQHLVQHARAIEPVLFYFTTSGHLVTKFTENAAHFTKELRQVSFSQVPDYHGLWHLTWDGLQYLGAV
jgi:hypothetical protein